MHVEQRRGNLLVSTDPTRLQLDTVVEMLRCSYWARGIPVEIVRRSIENSMCFGVYDGEHQVGFARVISDRATFAYIGDVIIADSHRRRGLGKWLMQVIMSHPELQELRRWYLATDDAHGLYEQYGFRVVKHPERHMEKRIRETYE